MPKQDILPFSKPPASICVLRLSAIGDVCHTVPVVNAIKDQWPETKITWIIGKVEAMLVGDLPGIEFIIYDKKTGRTGRKQIKQQLAGRNFDALLHMQVSIRSSMIARLIKARVKLGFDKARAKDYQWLFTNAKIPAKDRQHVMDGLFGFAEAIGVPRPQDNDLRWDIPLSEEDRALADKVIKKNCPNIVISPCSSNRSRNFRNWSVENYIAVAKHAIENHNAKIILTGGNTELEQQYGKDISAGLGTENCQNLIGKTNLKELLAILDKANAVICPDSGPAHMANTVRTPVIGLYATSNPLRTGPYFSIKKHYCINAYELAWHTFSGKNIREASWGQRVRAAGAMNLIKVADVVKKLEMAY